MYTPLKKTALHDLLNKPILFDANIFMVGISERTSDKNCSFENMKQLYIKPLFESFTDIYIHEEVYKELDEESRKFVDSYLEKNVTIVKEDGLYGTDPKYTMIFNNISKHELVNYERGRSKDRGEVYSLAYAAYHNINYFCSKEIMVDNVARELEDLKDIDIITFDIIILQAFVYYAQRNDTSNSKGLKSIYKKYCADVIKRHGLPSRLKRVRPTVIFDCVIYPRNIYNENTALYDMMKRYHPKNKTIIIADRNYSCFNTIAHFQQSDFYYLIRGKDVYGTHSIFKCCDLPDSEEFDVDISFELTRSKRKKYREHPERYKCLNSKGLFDFIEPDDRNGLFPVKFRMVKFKLSDDSYEYLLTNLSRNEFSIHDLKELYWKRWKIETAIDKYKYDIGAVNFHSKKENLSYRKSGQG